MMNAMNVMTPTRYPEVVCMTPAAGAHNNDVASCGHAGLMVMPSITDATGCMHGCGPPLGMSVQAGRHPAPIFTSSGGDGANEEARVYDGCDDDGVGLACWRYLLPGARVTAWRRCVIGGWP